MNIMQQMDVMQDLKNKVLRVMEELLESRNCIIKFRDSVVHQYKGDELTFVLHALDSIIKDLSEQIRKSKMTYDQLLKYQYKLAH